MVPHRRGWQARLASRTRHGSGGTSGGTDWGPFIQMPGALSFPMNMARYDWGMSSTPQEHLGGRKLVTVKGRPIAVFNLGGTFFGLLNRCPHQGGPIAEGVLCGLVESREPGRYRYSRAGEILRCPWHGWEFDIRTGRSWCEPDRIAVRSYAVEVAAGAAAAREPYAAETVPVSVEDEYVVVEV